MKEKRAWAVAGTPVNLSRWFALIAEGRDNDQWWHETRGLRRCWTSRPGACSSVPMQRTMA
eukprot:9918430-Heterocapsa_arctica.AAC.1